MFFLKVDLSGIFFLFQELPSQIFPTRAPSAPWSVGYYLGWTGLRGQQCKGEISPDISSSKMLQFKKKQTPKQKTEAKNTFKIQKPEIVSGLLAILHQEHKAKEQHSWEVRCQIPYFQ